MRRWLLAGCCVVSLAKAGELFGVFQPPPSPSRDIKIFKKQLMFHNINVLVDKAGQHDASIRVTARSAREAQQAIKGAAAISKKEGAFQFKSGANLQRGIVYTNFGYESAAIVNTADMITKTYTTSYQYNGVSLNYQNVQLQKANNFSIAYGQSW